MTADLVAHFYFCNAFTFHLFTTKLAKAPSLSKLPISPGSGAFLGGCVCPLQFSHHLPSLISSITSSLTYQISDLVSVFPHSGWVLPFWVFHIHVILSLVE